MILQINSENTIRKLTDLEHGLSYCTSRWSKISIAQQPPQSSDANGSAGGGGERDDKRAFRECALFDVSGSLQACKTNLVTAKLLASATGQRFHCEPADASGRPMRLNFEFGLNPIFPCVKLSLAATWLDLCTPILRVWCLPLIILHDTLFRESLPLKMFTVCYGREV